MIKNKLCMVIIMHITVGKSNAVISRALNINVNMIHKTWKSYKDQRRQTTESLSRSKVKEYLL